MDKEQTEQALGLVHEIRVSLNRYEDHLIKQLHVNQEERAGYKIPDLKLAKSVFIDAMLDLGVDLEGSLFVAWCDDNIKEIENGF